MKAIFYVIGRLCLIKIIWEDHYFQTFMRICLGFGWFRGRFSRHVTPTPVVYEQAVFLCNSTSYLQLIWGGVLLMGLTIIGVDVGNYVLSVVMKFYKNYKKYMNMPGDV